MKRLALENINTPEYFDFIWTPVNNNRQFYDAVRHRALASKIRCGDTVVDIGAGVYGTVQYVVEHMKNLEIFPVCYDQSHMARSIVVKKFPDILYMLGNLPETYLPSDSFDVVVAGEIIEHMEEPAKLAKELARICRPGGWVSISTVDVNSENAKKHGIYPEHLFEFEPRDLIDMFHPYGNPRFETCGDYYMLHVHKSR